MEILKDQELRAKTLVITAKDKICINDEVKCNPRDCSYAKGHFDRVNDAIMDILKNEDMISREVVLEYAKKHHVCPFEFSLDIALWADCIICDYNHVFDPRAYLRRFFDSREDYILLVDEAHNLPERAREMYSAEITKNSLMKYRSFWKESAQAVYQKFQAVNKWFIAVRKTFDKTYQ